MSTRLTCCLANYVGWKMRYVWRDCCLLITSNAARFGLPGCQVYSHTRDFKQQEANGAIAPRGAGTGLLWKWGLSREITSDVKGKHANIGGNARKDSKCCLRVFLTDWCCPWLRTSQIRDCIINVSGTFLLLLLQKSSILLLQMILVGYTTCLSDVK